MGNPTHEFHCSLRFYAKVSKSMLVSPNITTARG